MLLAFLCALLCKLFLFFSKTCWRFLLPCLWARLPVPSFSYHGRGPPLPEAPVPLSLSLEAIPPLGRKSAQPFFFFLGRAVVSIFDPLMAVSPPLLRCPFFPSAANLLSGPRRDPHPTTERIGPHFSAFPSPLPLRLFVGETLSFGSPALLEQ